MTDNVSVRKYGNFVELSFIFNSVTKDGYLVTQLASHDLKIVDPISVDTETCNRIKVLFEEMLAPAIQDYNDLISSKMTAEDIEKFIETGVPEGFDPHDIQKETENLMEIFSDTFHAFQDRFGDLFGSYDLQLNFKPKLKGPAPQ